MCRCSGCDTVYRLRISRCPRCHGTEIRQEVGIMPKIRRVGGATIAAHGHALADAVVPPVDVEPEPTEEEGQPTEELGGEQSSAGSSSSALPPSPPKSGGPSETPDPRPARSTASRSGPRRRAGSSARGTGGSGAGSTDA